MRRPHPTCYLAAWLAAVTVLIGPRPAAAFELRVSLLGTFERLGYQEQLDPNESRLDSALASCTVDGEPSTCFIDSDADVSNGVFGGAAFVRFNERVSAEASFQTAAVRGEATEFWTLAPNVNGAAGSSQRFQTDQLTYRSRHLDLRVAFLRGALQPFAGLRWSWARQVRSAFTDGQGNPNEGDLVAVEPIDSFWFLFGALGETASPWPGLTLGYRLEIGLPLSQTTTNSALTGFEFVDAGGYSIEASGSGRFPLGGPRLFGVVTAGSGVLHWNGSEVGVLDNRLAKWPENDTQVFRVTGSIEWVVTD